MSIFEVCSGHRDGSLDLVATDRAIGIRNSILFNGSWLSWSQLMPKALRHIAAETNAEGRIQLVGVDTAGTIGQSVEDSPTVLTYSPWNFADGQLRF